MLSGNSMLLVSTSATSFPATITGAVASCCCAASPLTQLSCSRGLAPGTCLVPAQEHQRRQQA